MAWSKRNESVQYHGPHADNSPSSQLSGPLPQLPLLQGLPRSPSSARGQRPHWPEKAEDRCRKQSSTLVERGRPACHANQQAGGFLGQSLADTSVVAGPKWALCCPEKLLGFLHVSQWELALNRGFPVRMRDIEHRHCTSFNKVVINKIVINFAILTTVIPLA